jgi:hypothetical protein
MMAIVTFGPSKSTVVRFSPCSGAWRLNPPMVDFGQLSVKRRPGNERGGCCNINARLSALAQASPAQKDILSLSGAANVGEHP